MSVPDTAEAGDVDRSPTFQHLRRFNLQMGGLHLIQGLAILLLSTSFALPITTSFLQMRGENLVPAPGPSPTFRSGRSWRPSYSCRRWLISPSPRGASLGTPPTSLAG